MTELFTIACALIAIGFAGLLANAAELVQREIHLAHRVRTVHMRVARSRFAVHNRMAARPAATVKRSNAA